MRSVLPTIEAWRAEGLAVARAVVVRTFGSSPLREGATMLRAADGRIAGSVSGGCVEGAVAGYLDEALATGRQRLVRFGISDAQAWEVGLACGGVIDVLVQPAIPEAALAAARAVWGPGVTDRSAGSVVVTTLGPGSPGATSGPSQVGPPFEVVPPLVVTADGTLSGTLGTAATDESLARAALAALERGVSATVELAATAHFVEVFPVRPRLVIVGGVPVAMALVRLARELGYETVVIDGRAAFATRERFPDVDRLVVAWPDEVADDLGLGPADAVAVLSHDPKFDDPAILAALRRGCRYVGAIGSRRTQRARRDRLLGEGLEEADLARLRGPIGLDLGGREPDEMALAILAEVVAARHGGSGRPLRDVVGDARHADQATDPPTSDGASGAPIIPPCPA